MLTTSNKENLMTQVNKIYYSICPDNNKYFRTIRIHKNVLTGNLQTQVSNPLYGTPPDELEPIPELMRTKLMSANNSLPYTK